ncbi:LPXTG cell wall anchor domain-containing protein [Agreia sp. COWG]|uniref:LPXTG cell wall anchor domain-containing protein n=1 Tax=Agreia sp. COWG TaxID=2773266 RepID=UPI00192585B8|nr:LPXTG cell wall anchor domain-containing protein [Agreia sp. COWG]CAD6008680.1 LPXTG-motif cell wall anchor domain-containing protein [Agreia sp. COWG]
MIRRTSRSARLVTAAALAAVLAVGFTATAANAATTETATTAIAAPAASGATTASTTPATTATPAAPANSAFGVQMLDSDGETLQASTPLAEWTAGDTVTQSAASTGDLYKLNTTQTAGLVSRAASDGARSTIASGTFQLRDRVPVAFTGLTSECTADGSSTVSFDTLTVNGVDALDPARIAAGYTVDLPDSPTWGPTKLYIGERTTDASGRAQTTALRIEAEAGSSEIWRVKLGQVDCTHAAPATTPALVSGITVTAPNGTPIVAGEPSLAASGTKTDATFSAKAPPIAATGVTVSRTDDSAAKVSIDSFTQVPDTSSIGEYMWSAFRVYGLALDVAADGSSVVSFPGSNSGLFVNGVWINTGTDLYTGLDAQGTPRVTVRFNERVTQPDGSVLITAVHYTDLTGAYPSVALGTVRWSAPSTAPTPDPEPTPQPEPPLPSRYAYALSASGPSVVSPVALVTPDAAAAAAAAASASSASASSSTSASSTASASESEKAPNTAANSDVTASDAGTLGAAQLEVATVTDGVAGQISASGARASNAAGTATAEVDSLALYPGSSLAVSLSNIRVAVTKTGATMTTGGGTVAGQTIAAGAIAPNTVVQLPGRSAVITLNLQKGAAADFSVTGVDVNDSLGLGARVRVAAITADAPDVPTPVGGGSGTNPGPGSSGGGSSAGGSSDGGSSAAGSGELGNGAIGQNFVSPQASSARPLANTGMSTAPLAVAAALSVLALAAGVGVLGARRRRRRSSAS